MKPCSWPVRVLLVASLYGCSSNDAPANPNAMESSAAQGSTLGQTASTTSSVSSAASGGMLNTAGPSGTTAGALTGGPNAGTTGAATGPDGMSTTSGMSSSGTSAGTGGANTTGANTTGTNTGDPSTVTGVGGGTATGAGGSTSTAGPSTTGSGGAESKFLVFLLLGQSNMEGAPQPENQDREENPRIKVLAYDNCPSLNREYGKWYTASPPLHSCGGGVGPGDYFAKTLIESLPDDYTIGLVPCGVNGAPIDLFLKDVPRNSHVLPPDNHWETGYEWIISRAVEAQKTGTIAGILFHQGESNLGQSDWVSKVQGFVSDLRTDLALGEVPFLAGEVYYDGSAAAHNTLIQQLPDSISNAFVISAEGLTGTDVYHFDLASQRELGKRYGVTMQEALALP